MSNPLLQSLFSDMSLGVLNIALKSLLPDDFDWIASAATGALSAVDDIDAAEDIDGMTKGEAVKKIITDTLDAEDDIPGWADLGEIARDELIFSIVDLAYVIFRFSQNGKLSEAQEETLGASVGSLITVGLRLARTRKDKPTRPVDTLKDPETRTTAIDKILADLRS